MVTDTIDGVLIDEDEDGFYMILSGGNAEYRFNIHAVAEEVLNQARGTIGPWAVEGELALRTRPAVLIREDNNHYDIRDPKHPDHHDTFGDAA